MSFSVAVVAVSICLFSLTIRMLTVDTNAVPVGQTTKSCQQFYLDFTYLQVALFGFLSILLCVIMCKLFRAIETLPDMDLADEKRQLKIMFVCFELSFVTQCIFLQLNAFELKQGHIQEFAFMSLTLILPVLLDGTSIFVIVLLHRYAYNPY